MAMSALISALVHIYGEAGAAQLYFFRASTDE